MFGGDASVYVAAHQAGDRHHGRSLRWFERCLEDRVRLVAPLLLVVEASAAVRRISGSREEGELMAANLSSGRLVELFPLNLERARHAASIAARTSARGADAIYLALAEEAEELSGGVQAEGQRLGLGGTRELRGAELCGAGAGGAEGKGGDGGGRGGEGLAEGVACHVPVLPVEVLGRRGAGRSLWR